MSLAQEVISERAKIAVILAFIGGEMKSPLS